jgi:16S rRNA (uracil1498-N3)-methyltransferase
VSRARLIVASCPRAGSAVLIAGEEASHARALRLARGDGVVLIDGTGMEAHGTVAKLTRAGMEVLVDRLAQAPDSPVDITLFIAGLRLERLAWIAEKATELSIRRVVVVASERAQRFRATSASIGRLARVVREAAKQCESARWPEVDGPISAEEIWSSFEGHRLFLDLGGERFPGHLPAGPVALMVGPEGGWSESERQRARESGWQAVALPAGKLRAETAAVAAVVLARAALLRN